MIERHIIQKAIMELTKNGGYAWSGTSWKDIFGIFDICSISENGVVSFYQVSTKDHRWSRIKKIDAFRALHPMPRFSYLMLWDYKANQFQIESL
jgi:hypothetical protein